MQFTERIHLTHLEECDLVESKKKKRAMLYRLSTPDGLLPECPQLPTPEAVERGHMGTSDKSRPGSEDSPAEGQVKDEEGNNEQ